MSHSTTFAAASLLAAAAVSVSAAWAVPPVDRSDGPERIDYAGKLGMLSQRIAASACNVEAGIGGRVARGYLLASVGEFDRIMAALERGDVFIGIRGPETDGSVLRAVEAVQAVWAPTRAAAAAGEATPSASDLLDRSERLVGEVTGHYADPTALLVGDALTLDAMARARMLSQVMSRHACEAGAGRDGAAADLRDAMDVYALTLAALRDGRPGSGVARPSDPAVSDALAVATAAWAAIRPTLDDIASGAPPTPAAREAVFAAMNDLTAAMNEVAARHAASSKQRVSLRN